MIHTSSEPITDHESLRRQNIERNKEFLKSLGLSPSSSSKPASRRPSESKRKNYKMNQFEISQDDAMLRRSSRLSSTVANANVNTKSEVTMDSIKDEVVPSKKSRVVMDSTDQKVDYIRPEPAPGSSRTFVADLDPFYKILGYPISEYGKAAVMSMANGGRLPKFSKYSGVVEWANCTFLWVNIFDKSERDKSVYANEFIDGGRCIRWFGGSKMHSESEVTKRLLRAKKGSDSDKENDSVVLFVRIEGENYTCLGRVLWREYDFTVNPVSFVWELQDFEAILPAEYFQKILSISTVA